MKFKDRKIEDFLQKHLTIFEYLKKLFLHSLLVFFVSFKAQDKIYFMDGTSRVAKVLEISPDHITFVPLSESGAPFINSNETVARHEIILIEYKAGYVEIYTVPDKTAVYNSEGLIKKDPKKDAQDLAFNFLSINSFALCNADISISFEHLVLSKKMGVGFIGTYNFNSYAILPNNYLLRFYNAKKNYDIGAFLNLYPGHFRRRTTFYLGLMAKYMSFDYSSVVEDNTNISTNITYTSAKGGQFSVLTHLGTHTNFSKNFFIKTLAGIGLSGFQGKSKSQFNYLVNRNRAAGDPELNYSIMPKLYVGLNLGFSF